MSTLCINVQLFVCYNFFDLLFLLCKIYWLAAMLSLSWLIWILKIKTPQKKEKTYWLQISERKVRRLWMVHFSHCPLSIVVVAWKYLLIFLTSTSFCFYSQVSLTLLPSTPVHFDKFSKSAFWLHSDPAKENRTGTS